MTAPTGLSIRPDPRRASFSSLPRRSSPLCLLPSFLCLLSLLKPLPSFFFFRSWRLRWEPRPSSPLPPLLLPLQDSAEWSGASPLLPLGSLSAAAAFPPETLSLAPRGVLRLLDRFRASNTERDR